ncbi:aromatase/cyclase [Micromonospora sp. NPDC049230]|uniref:aromatase/cyclase n=1 Tax=Micromonospora sp. NPDC049230 TaxID=3155502 RepID=UPI0033E9791E
MTHRRVHSRVVAAPAATVYGLVADVSRWPVIFEPSIHVHHLERGDGHERFQLWATVNGEVKTWTSRRTLDPRALRITFRQEHSQPPVTSMSGEWIFRPQPDGGTEIVLVHEFSVAGGERQVALLEQALDANSERELAALGRIGELGHPVDDLVFTFSDEVELPGAAADVYDFVYRSDRWPDALPHVRRVVLREEEPGIQDMEMKTVTGDGSTHTTRSVRVCLPGERIVYKQLVPPALLTGHSGSWLFSERPGGSLVVAEHTVAINPAAITSVLGAGKTVADARSFLREALGRNSRATLTYAGAYASERAALSPDEGVPR